MTNSLRDELSAAPAPVPPFTVLLPEGWASERPTKESMGALADRASAVLRSVHRPDLDARIRAMTDRATAQLLRRDPVRMMYPSDVPPDEMFPLSILVVKVTDPGGGSLDRRVQQLVRTHDARPFDEDAQLLCWESEDALQLDGGRAAVRSYNYLVAVPGTRRHEALLFTGVLPVAGDGQTMDEGTVRGARALMNAIMSTFRWDAA
jgi:hypothetical protein